MTSGLPLLVFQLAAAWSLDPTSLDAQKLPPSVGIVGRLTPDRATPLRSKTAIGVILVLLSLAAAAPAAAADYPRWTLRLRGLSSGYEHDFTYSYQQATGHLRIDNGMGLEAAAEFRPQEHFGVEVGIGSLGFDAKAWTTYLRPVSIDPLVFEEVTRRP